MKLLAPLAALVAALVMPPLVRAKTTDSAAHGRLEARPIDAAPSSPAGRRTAIDVPGDRDAILSVPAGVDPRRPTPLVLMLHGAGGSANGGLGLIGQAAERSHVAVLAVSSAASTWDVIADRGFGRDVERIDVALAETFRRVRVDPDRIAIAGFSDGASYALSLGLTNGDLFREIAAFAPGFTAPGEPHDRPRILVSHGQDDRVLPIDRCSRRLVPRLERAGYDVTYREIESFGHGVPPTVAREAMERLSAR